MQKKLNTSFRIQKAHQFKLYKAKDMKTTPFKLMHRFTKPDRKTMAEMKN